MKGVRLFKLHFVSYYDVCYRFFDLHVRIWCVWEVCTIIIESNALPCFFNQTTSVMLFITKTQVSWYISNQFSLLVGNKCHQCWPGGLLPAPPSLPLCDWQLSISVNHQSSPLSPTPSACARWALNWCLVQRYQMARQMTSPWPHYTHTQRRSSVLTEQQVNPTRTTSQHANPWN